jgi:hypothetical protein
MKFDFYGLKWNAIFYVIEDADRGLSGKFKTDL